MNARKLHVLVDIPNAKECKRLGASPSDARRQQLKAVLTGEFRVPKKGEWYLSGAVPEAYKASTDIMRHPYHILRLVRPVKSLDGALFLVE